MPALKTKTKNPTSVGHRKRLTNSNNTSNDFLFNEPKKRKRIGPPVLEGWQKHRETVKGYYYPVSFKS